MDLTCRLVIMKLISVSPFRLERRRPKGESPNVPLYLRRYYLQRTTSQPGTVMAFEIGRRIRQDQRFSEQARGRYRVAAGRTERFKLTLRPCRSKRTKNNAKAGQSLNSTEGRRPETRGECHEQDAATHQHFHACDRHPRPMHCPRHTCTAGGASRGRTQGQNR